MNEELLDVVDERGRSVGSAPRDVCHSDCSMIHRTVAVLVFDSSGRLFLQRRSASKDMYAGMWDVSASGHVRAGEAAWAAAGRELREELGIGADLRHVGSVLVREPLETEYAEVFRCVYDGQLFPNPNELEGGDYFDPDRGRHGLELTPFAAAVLDFTFDL